VYRTVHKLLLPAVLLLFSGQVLSGQNFLPGVFQSPKGAGVTAVFDHGGEMDIFTLRTDFYGLLSGRTRDVGAVLSYSHDYVFYRTDGEDYALSLHAGAGGMLGWVHDFEPGFFSEFDRRLDHNPGVAAGATGNFGLRLDFARCLTLDVSLSVHPGIHVRMNRSTGALLADFYKGGVYHAYYPQINLLYRF
jgi:hypothetical protein